MATYPEYMKYPAYTLQSVGTPIDFPNPEYAEVAILAFTPGKNPSFGVWNCKAKYVNFKQDSGGQDKWGDYDPFESKYFSNYKLITSVHIEQMEPKQGSNAMGVIYAPPSFEAKAGASVVDIFSEKVISYLPDAVQLNPALKAAIRDSIEKAFKVP